MEFPNIESLVEEISRLRKSHELLEKLYLEIGPYPMITEKSRESVGIRFGEIRYDKGLWPQICDHFDFDDSE